jgi:hypothetical protein
MVEYYQGETILFEIEGDGVINLDDKDFVVLFYKQGHKPIEIKKSELTKESDNVYSGEIANTVTKTMPLGQHIQEVLNGTTQTIILQEKCFEIKASQSKNLIE